MTPETARTVVIDAITKVAPDTDPSSLPGDVEFVEELELDSMDFLNIVVAIEEATGRTVPERDYPQLATLDDVVAYLVARE